jgi:hemolysin D
MSAYHRWQAAKDLWQHYVQVFSHFWRQRNDTLRSDFFNKQEAEFLPASLSLQETPGSASLRWTARLLMAIVAFALVWAIFGRIDIVVNASGKVIPTARTKTIGSVDIASVRGLHVTEGQRVRAGDLLIELDSSGSDAEHEKAQDSLVQAQLQVARSRAMLAAVQHLRKPLLGDVPGVGPERVQEAQLQLDCQFHDFQAKLLRIDGDLARYSKALPLAQQRAQDFDELQKQQAVSRHAWLEREQARLELEGQLADVRNQRAAYIAQTQKEAHDALTEASKIVVASTQDRWRAGERSKLLKLTAPIDGTVQQLVVHTVGGVVPAAQPLMQIVPDDSMAEVEAFVENKDVGFVHVGQLAQVKVDAFDYTRFGTISARVTHVSQDAIQDENKGLLYAARVSLDSHTIEVNGKQMPLSAGMSVNVGIKTGTRRVIEYVLSPLVQHQQEALRER